MRSLIEEKNHLQLEGSRISENFSEWWSIVRRTENNHVTGFVLTVDVLAFVDLKDVDNYVGLFHEWVHMGYFGASHSESLCGGRGTMCLT